jgi:carbonic anhydrase
MRAVEITYRYQAGDTSPRERPSDSAEAKRRLDEGNKAFAALLDNLADEGAPARRVILVDPHDLGLLGDDEGSPSQRPFAAVLGCADARVPVELIFNEGPNDLFVVRLAGNVLGGDSLASLGYAADHLGESLKLIAVLGHSGCGAVTAAVDVFLDPRGYLDLASQHLLRNLLDRLLVVVHASAKNLAAAFGAAITGHPRYREALIEVSALGNAALGAYTVQQHLGTGARGGLRAAYGVYVLDTRQVWAPRAGSAEVLGLADPPTDHDGFAQLAHAAMASERIRTMLA